MRKIPTLFVRDPNDLRFVTREVNPDCQWVIDGEGVATRMHDGTCVMFDGAKWWARREVKPGKSPPSGFILVDFDTAAKRYGWEPIEHSPFVSQHADALAHAGEGHGDWPKGTYELCGPRINGNPSKLNRHTLIEHASAGELIVPRDFDGLARQMKTFPYEGVVWHHEDGRMAKLKRRDFPSANPA